MKLYLLLFTVFTLLVTTAIQATTLKLSTGIELLVLDGKAISGSLLKVAEGLELEQGQHQIVFRVTKMLPEEVKNDARNFISAPMIATFSSYSKSVTIQLPAMDNRQDASKFNRLLGFKIINEYGIEVASQRDHLIINKHEEPEKVVLDYNQKRGSASAPRFIQATKEKTALPLFRSLLKQDIAQPKNLLLKKWYCQTGKVSHLWFLSWLELTEKPR